MHRHILQSQLTCSNSAPRSFLLLFWSCYDPPVFQILLSSLCNHNHVPFGVPMRQEVSLTKPKITTVISTCAEGRKSSWLACKSVPLLQIQIKCHRTITAATKYDSTVQMKDKILRVPHYTYFQILIFHPAEKPCTIGYQKKYSKQHI